MTDYELIVSCKQGSNRAMETLFFRYQNFLKKRYSHFIKLCPTRIIDFDDFQSEAFIWFKKAVVYVKLERITAPEKWRFLTPYMWFVDNMVTAFVKEHRESLDEILLSTPVHHAQDICADVQMFDTLSLETEFDALPEKLACQEVVTESFMRSLTMEERRIVEAYRKTTEPQKTLIVKSIAKELGCSKQWLYIQLARIRTKFRQEMSCMAY